MCHDPRVRGSLVGARPCLPAQTLVESWQNLQLSVRENLMVLSRAFLQSRLTGKVDHGVTGRLMGSSPIYSAGQIPIFE